ncbi:Sulfotransferase 1A4 [Fragariocoptes setiger]|uniref:Sulfotransferase 1A4 n=1 Tax=Fragariocoptes setiger TaxID=1670756 RepID=A0ABQ7S7P5_9ACAR|nr:Sulfotransferase 1A4 [Fragariocoptes setiger]
MRLLTTSLDFLYNHPIGRMFNDSYCTSAPYDENFYPAAWDSDSYDNRRYTERQQTTNNYTSHTDADRVAATATTLVEADTDCTHGSAHKELSKCQGAINEIRELSRCQQMAFNHRIQSERHKQYVLSIPEAKIYRGLLMQGYLVPNKLMRKLSRFKCRDSDVFVCTYPKSGTTFCSELTSAIHERANTSKLSRCPLHERVVHLEIGRPLGQWRHLKGLPSPRLMASHLPLTHMPDGVLTTRGTRIIYVLRNPKDTCVSYYHHHARAKFLGGRQIEWHDFVELFAAGQLVYGDWYAHVRSYHQLSVQQSSSESASDKGKGKILFVTYEQMIVDLKRVIANVAAFIGVTLSGHQIDIIEEHCRFDNMRYNPMANRECTPLTDLFDSTRGKFMRKGQIGDWQNYFTDEQSRQFDRRFEQRLRHELNLKLCYTLDEARQMYCSHNYDHDSNNHNDRLYCS